MRGWPKHVDRKYEYIPLTTTSLLLLNNNYTIALIFWFIHLRLLKAEALYCLHQLLFIICQACRGVAIQIHWYERSELYIESIRYIWYNFCLLLTHSHTNPGLTLLFANFVHFKSPPEFSSVHIFQRGCKDTINKYVKLQQSQPQDPWNEPLPPVLVVFEEAVETCFEFASNISCMVCGNIKRYLSLFKKIFFFWGGGEGRVTPKNVDSLSL